MPEDRYPTKAEFWKRLDKRKVEPDLKEALLGRAARQTGSVARLGKDATVVAFVERILPGSAVPPMVIAQFLDENFDKPMGRADERTGVMPRSQLLPAGFQQLDLAAGGSFSDLSPERQDEFLAQAEKGTLGSGPGFDSSVWFKRLRDLVLLAFGADPRGMVQMGYPGPSYKPGHLWLGKGEIAARMKRRAGYLEL
jgi:hypothetical protein